MLNIVLFGPPGAGKGTQSARLVERYNLVHLSTGDIFRWNIREETDLGKMARNYMERGALVPDEITIGMLGEELTKHPNANGFIFDGFPRTEAQAEALDEFMSGRGDGISAMIALEVPEEELKKRLIHRGDVSGRPDDMDPDIINNRLQVYKQETAPVAGYYRKQKKYRPIAGTGSIDEIADLIAREVDKLMGKPVAPVVIPVVEKPIFRPAAEPVVEKPAAPAPKEKVVKEKPAEKKEVKKAPAVAEKKPAEKPAAKVAKKATKKSAPKPAKKVVKKVAKKATKKASPKPVKKAVKKASGKSAKKAIKKASPAKKVTKKPTPKPVKKQVKKIVKKATKKVAVKKAKPTAKRPVQKKSVAKKPSRKTANKPVRKSKPTPKKNLTKKKPAPKKPIKKSAGKSVKKNAKKKR
ncbi:MAG: adenylate kinase [Flavobacteriales bacterium]|nr:adenylate kinase [Flavobacteriales bacterium]